MKLKLGWTKGDKLEDENTPKSARGLSMFGRKKKHSLTADSNASPGISDYSVDQEALSRMREGENTPPSQVSVPLQKHLSDAQSSNLRQLEQLVLADCTPSSNAQHPQQPPLPPPSPTDVAVQAIKESSAQLAAAAEGSKAHRSSCLALAAFASSVVQVLEARAPVAASPDQLHKVARLLSDGANVVSSCFGLDWLLLAASPDLGISEAMHTLHTDVLAKLKEEGLDSVPGSMRLAGPDYRDGSKSLLRRLKQLGGGSLSAGVAAVAEGEEQQLELARALEVEAEDVKRSACHVLKAVLLGGDPAFSAAESGAVAAHRAELERIFASYAAFGLRDQQSQGSALVLDSFRCAKMMREGGVLGGRLRPQDLDVMFAQAARRGSARRLGFEGFLQLLALIADKKRVDLEEVVDALVKVEGPTVRATTPENVKWHDDKSTYTGVYARGMSVLDETPDLSRLVDRDAAEKAQRRASLPSSRRTSLPPTDGSRRHTPGATPISTPRLSRTASGTGSGVLLKDGARLAAVAAAGSPAYGSSSPRIGAHGSQEDSPASAALDPRTNHSLRDMWKQFAAFGRSGTAGDEVTMDGAQFMKLCRDSGLLGKQLNSTRVDLTFRTTASKGSRRITYPQFVSALPRLAEARGCEEEELVQLILGCGGPSRNNTTTPEAVRLSDRNNFTGIAARGGPTTVEKERITLASMCDRSGRRSSLAPSQ